MSALLKLFFRLLYHEFAFTYDWVATLVSVGMWNEWVRSALPFLKGEKVLELGHGPGHLQLALHEQGVRPFGLDRSRQMGRQAFGRLAKKGYSPALVNSYAQNTPFPSAFFDQVVATFPSEYILAPETLAEIHRILRPGASFIVIPVAWITGKRPLERAAAWLFKVTGQAPNWDQQLEARILDLPGFSVTLHRQQLPSSLLVIIEAIKDNDEKPQV